MRGGGESGTTPVVLVRASGWSAELYLETADSWETQVCVCTPACACVGMCLVNHGFWSGAYFPANSLERELHKCTDA